MNRWKSKIIQYNDFLSNLYEEEKNNFGKYLA